MWYFSWLIHYKSLNVVDLLGGTAEENVQVAYKILNGKGNDTLTESICMNAGALIYISKKADSLYDGYKKCKESIMSGNALDKLQKIVYFSN